MVSWTTAIKVLPVLVLLLSFGLKREQDGWIEAEVLLPFVL